MEHSTNYEKVKGPLLRMLLTSSILQSSCQHNSTLHMGHIFSTPAAQSPASTDRVDDSQLKDPQLIKYVTESVASPDEEAILHINGYLFLHRYLYINKLREKLLWLADELTVSRPHLVRAIMKIAEIAREKADELEDAHKKFIDKKITKRDLDKAILETLDSFLNQNDATAKESADPLLANMVNAVWEDGAECYNAVCGEVKKAYDKEKKAHEIPGATWPSADQLTFIQACATTALSTIPHTTYATMRKKLLELPPEARSLLMDIKMFEPNLKHLMEKAEMKFGHEQGKPCGICEPVQSSSAEENLPMQASTHPLMCGHYFHVDCLKKWFNNRRMAKEEINCPTCRKEISFNRN